MASDSGMRSAEGVGAFFDGLTALRNSRKASVRIGRNFLRCGSSSWGFSWCGESYVVASSEIALMLCGKWEDGEPN
jgi:hypothetical protein